MNFDYYRDDSHTQKYPKKEKKFNKIFQKHRISKRGLDFQFASSKNLDNKKNSE